MNRIYFDICATTPLDPKVSSLVHKIENEIYGNPSSIHREGQAAKAVIEKSRIQLSKALHCLPEEIIFTSSGTESNNLILKGLLNAGDHFITTSYEHPAILQVIPSLEEKNVEISIINPNRDGFIEPESIISEIKRNTRLISIMFVNNELGTINPINEILRITNKHGILLHSDAVQALGKIPINLQELPIDFLSMSAHKLYGPKGSGALFKRKGLSLKPLISGGGQESNMRASTENISGIGGFGLAAELAIKKIIENSNHIKELETYFIDELNNNNINYKINGTNRVPGVLNVTFPDIDGNNLIMQLDMYGIAISFGSACASGTAKTSSILLKMGLTSEEALSTVRISFGKIHTAEQIKTMVNKIHTILKRHTKKFASYEG